jgi:thymidine kinase
VTAPAAADLLQLDEARRDPAIFADVLLGEPLWPHQIEVARSGARYRVICAGRRAGKTKVFAVLALHRAVAHASSKVLIISTGEVAARRMFAEIARMASRARWVASSVSDETKSMLVFENRSVIECVPASMAQIRSAEADLLIIDEAAFVDEAIWEAAEPTIAARRGSKVLLASTPWADSDHFFNVLWQQGIDAQADEGAEPDSPDAQGLGSVEDAPARMVQSWHWPSSISPEMSDEFLAHLERTRPREYFQREYLAIRGDVAGTYFAASDIKAAIDPRPMLEPRDARQMWAIGGVDWGQRHDASTLVTVVFDEKATYERQKDVRYQDRRPVYRVAYLFEEFGKDYRDVIARIVEAAHGYTFQLIVTETNGVGQMPSEELHLAMWKAVERANSRAGVGLFGSTSRMADVPVVRLTTTTQTKADAFGLLRMLLQQKRLLLPNHPGLLKQLRALRFEQLAGGNIRISVPERVGHDDLAMGLALAASQLLELERTYIRRPPPPAAVTSRWAHVPDHR